MKQEKILNAIPMMQELDDTNLDLVINAIKSCKAVQMLNDLSDLSAFSEKVSELKARVN